MSSLQHLSPDQRETLEQFESITNRSDERSSFELLEQSRWNLQAAIDRVYDGGTGQYSPPSPPRGESTSPPVMDDSLLPSSTPTHRRRTRTTTTTTTNGLGTGIMGLYYLRQALAVPIQIISWPLSIVVNLGLVVLGFVARILGIRISTSSLHARNPFSSSPPGTSSSMSGATFRRTSTTRRPNTILSPASAAQDWVDQLNRLLRSDSATRRFTRRSGRHLGDAETTGIEVGTSSGLSRRAYNSGDEDEDGDATTTTRKARVELPEFHIGGYETALRRARDEMRLLMVVLTCREHERDDEFKLEVVADPALVKLLKDENVLVWAGDVMEKDAYVVGRTLSYTALPFVAFIALQPTNTNATTTTTASTSSPRLSLVSRLEPTRPSLPTLSASHISAHLESTVLTKVKPYLARLAHDKRERERVRIERERRELEHATVAKRDEERILSIRRAIEIKRREELAEAEERERRRLRDVEARRRARRAREWRIETRATKFGPLVEQPKEGDGDGAVRVVVRLGNGKRAMRTFSNRESVRTIYEWVECELGLDEDDRIAAAASEEEDDSGDDQEGERGDYVQKFAFRLATTFPRRVIELPRDMFEKAAPATSSSRRSLDSSAPSRESFDSLESQRRDDGDEEGQARVESVGVAFKEIGRDVNLVIDGLEDRRRLSMSSRERGSDDDDDDEEEEEEDSEEDD